MTDAGRENAHRYTIAMVAACPYPTCQGSQTLIRQLSEALVRHGHRVHLVCYHFGEDIPLTDNPGLRLHRISYPAFYRKYRAGPALQKPLLDLLLTRKLIRVIHKHDIDIIHAHNYEGLMVGLQARIFTRTPVVFHSHNAISDELHRFFRTAWARRVSGWLAARIDRCLPRRADHVIALNEDLVEFFGRQAVALDRITCLPPGIELEAWSDKIDPGRETAALEGFDKLLLRSEGSAPANSPVAVYAGNLDDYQNLPLMFRAFADVRNTFPEAILAVVSRSDPESIQKVARALGIGDGVIFVPHESFAVVREVFRRSRVALCPRTSWCGFPIKLLNYMAAGLPVVACRGSAKAVDHRITGLMVENDDVRGFAEAIETLFGNREMAEAMGRRGAERAGALHGWDAVLDRLETVYQAVMGLDRRRA